MTDLNQGATAPTDDSVQNQDATPITPSSDPAPSAPETDAQAQPNDDDAPTKESPPKKKPSGLMKRVDKLTYEKNEAMRQAETAQLKAQQLEYRLAQIEARQRPNQQQLQAPYGQQQPVDEDAAYDQLMSDLQSRMGAQKAQDQLVQKASDFIETLPDPDVQDFLMSPNSGLTEEMGEVILALPKERGHMLASHLADNPGFVKQLARMPVHLQATELATFEAKATGNAPAQTGGQSGQAPASRVSSAPSPAPTVGGTTAVSKNPSDMTPQEYVKYWRAKEAS